MPKSNVHILSADDHKYFNDKYMFIINGDSVLVQIKDYNRTTAHPLDKSFALKTLVRKLTISKEALSIWSTNFYRNQKYQTITKEDMYTLIDIQNAINMLIVAYQAITFENVLDVLRHSKLK